MPIVRRLLLLALSVIMPFGQFCWRHALSGTMGGANAGLGLVPHPRHTMMVMDRHLVRNQVLTWMLPEPPASPFVHPPVPSGPLVLRPDT